MLKNYKYPLKVWLTSAILGTVLGLIVNYVDSYFSFIGTLAYEVRGTGELVSYFLTICLIALVLSIPCWFVLWLIYYKLAKPGNNKGRSILTLLGVGQVLCWGVFALLSSLDDEFTLFMGGGIVLPYAIVVALSIWFYFPERASSQVAHEI